MNTIEIIKRLIRQKTVTVGQPVTNIHGRSAMTVLGASAQASVSWLRLTVPGTELPGVDEFYQRYSVLGEHSFDLLDGVLGVLEVHEPTVVVQLFRGVIAVDHPTTLTLDVTMGASSSRAALYVDGVLDRTKSGALSTQRQLDAGKHLVEIIAVGSDVTITVPTALAIDGLADVVPRPSWQGAATGYMDTTTGASVVRLQWLADSRCGGWKVFRREVVNAGAVTAVGVADTNGQCAFTVTGNAESSLFAGSDLLVGQNLVGTVLSAKYSDSAGTTSVRVQLAKTQPTSKQAWVGQAAVTGANVELTRVKRTSSGGAVTFNDTTSAFKGQYIYTLQAYSLFDETVVSDVSDPLRVVAGDVTPPGSITIWNKGVPISGYPQVKDKVARVKYRTPLDDDYAGVRVVYRTSVTGTVTSVSGTTIGVSASISDNQVQNYTFRPTNGAADHIERQITANTATELTLDDTYDSVNLPAVGDTFLAYSDATVVIDYGVPNTDDELQFTTVGYGTYQFRAFDLVGNEQQDQFAESWDYSSADDNASATPVNLPPSISISQVDDATQATFFAGGDARNNSTQYAIIQLDAADETDGTTGVVIFYSIIGSGVTNSLAASTAATAGVVDAGGTVASPNGTRSRYVLLTRGSAQGQLIAWAQDKDGMESGRVPFTADYDVTPEIVSVETRDLGGTYQFTVSVDDDTRGIRYWMEPSGSGDYPVGSPAHVDTSTQKTKVFTSVINDGTLKVIRVVPYSQFTGGQATGTAGDTWSKEISRTPRTTAVFESRDQGGNISGTTVRANLLVQPVRNAIASRTTAASGNTTTTLTDSGSPGWTVDQYSYSEFNKRFYFIEFTSGAMAGQVRKITGNSAGGLTFAPALASAPDSVTYKLWNAATVVTTDGFVVGTETPIGTTYLVGNTLWFDRRGSTSVTFSYYSLLNGTNPESLHTASVDQDTQASLTGFNVTESPAGTLVSSVESFDDDTKYWRLYAKKGGLPTTGGAALSRNPSTNRLNLDEPYLRWEDTPANPNFSFTAGAGTWYLILVPYNSYNEDGDAQTVVLSASGAGASPTPALTGLSVTPNGSSENDIGWSLVNLPDPTGYTVQVSAQLDSGASSVLNTVAASALTYAHTGIGTRVADNSSGTWKVYTYTLQLKDTGGAPVGSPTTVQRGDYFAGAVPAVTAVSAIVQNGGSAFDAGGSYSQYQCTSSHDNQVTWTITGANDTEYSLELYSNGTLITVLNPSDVSYDHIEDGIFGDASGAVRSWVYTVTLVRRSDSTVVSTMDSATISDTVRSCFAP